MTPTTRAVEYQAANQGAVLIDRDDRARLRIAGPDRAKFLHNLTTHDMKRLPAGEGREAFVTSPQGKTLGYVRILATDDSLWLLTDAAAVASVLPHLQKYGVFDDVTIDDLSAETFEFHLAGPATDTLIGNLGGPSPSASELDHSLVLIGGASVRIARDSLTGRPGWTLIGERADAALVSQALRDAAGSHAGLIDLGPEAFDALRIEGGFPIFGRDLTSENLPQEVARDATAISFVKGCYLGQETVARIDALGHVNKLLRGLRFPGQSEPPEPGTPIEAEGKAIGKVTSAAYSPGWGCVVALGYVRRSHAEAGTAVLARSDAVVCDLPMIPVA
ncbi:MAG: folate-binding protein YgfZ [Isosphaeraceae bacterium]